ncbi:sigma-70 family RNA polymerase sigma factor [Catenuloplanes atrovinosus]|uniref:RNA polymerase sigma-70 factor (ECF subfamily) n=1 Tax=Catenuloplanes atrovinosus TaxID=137266 RepID=A0AAE3YN31_9ACTN|nr:sigma-70 family RNA polymerase sigma factor [Catenuloplanes atrovinosus]MDR7275169.1 RNA polymerase sigma-70 factor (ECF subfamily) [Catenuloplanes atrovinosus]
MRAGISDGLEDLYREHGAVLLATLTRVTGGDAHLAADVLQETAIRAWQHPEARNECGTWNRAWLITVARRIAIDHLRSARARTIAVADEHLEGRIARAEDEAPRMIDRLEVRAALASLSDSYRKIIVSTYFEGRTVAELAGALGIPEGTVKSRTFYALKSLRAALIRRGYLDG